MRKDIIVKKRNCEDLNIPYGKMAAHDWFRCERCGYEQQMRVLGNYATCPKCGGTMKRT